MDSILFRMLLGHLVGDYILQNNYMALNKKNMDTWAGPIHCCIWTLCILFFCPEFVHKTSEGGYLSYCFAAMLIYFSHMVLDCTNLVDKFLDKIGGRSYRSTEEYCARKDVSFDKKIYMRAYTAIVQTVADNTLHLLMLFGIFKFYGVI